MHSSWLNGSKHREQVHCILGQTLYDLNSAFLRPIHLTCDQVLQWTHNKASWFDRTVFSHSLHGFFGILLLEGPGFVCTSPPKTIQLSCRVLVSFAVYGILNDKYILPQPARVLKLKLIFSGIKAARRSCPSSFFPKWAGPYRSCFSTFSRIIKAAMSENTKYFSELGSARPVAMMLHSLCEAFICYFTPVPRVGGG